MFRCRSYLEALHERGQANADHTTLLLNCVAKLKDVDKLDRFIKRDTAHFEVETAIRVCRQANYHQHALCTLSIAIEIHFLPTCADLAETHREHDWALRILLDDLADYEKALRYMGTLAFDDVALHLKTHGTGSKTGFVVDSACRRQNAVG